MLATAPGTEERSGDSGSESPDPTGTDFLPCCSRPDSKAQERRKRVLPGDAAQSALPGGSADAWPPTRDDGTSTPSMLAAYQHLNPVQRAIIQRMKGMLDTGTHSVVITNPLMACSPIVFVTEAWQKMCGYTMEQAVGQNPRLTQGEGTDKETVRGMGIALANRRACKVRLINYRGHSREPFWNCLSVSGAIRTQRYTNLTHPCKLSYKEQPA
jgi:hypothetical protein